MITAIVSIVGWSVASLVSLILICKSLFTVKQQTVAIIERFGRFNRLANSGLNIKIPFIERIINCVSLRDQQLPVTIETKTEDNVFIKIIVAVQYRTSPLNVYDRYYKLSDFDDQVSAYIFDVVRAEVPKLKLDDVFAKKDDIANAIAKELTVNMSQYGTEIIKTLITDIDPDKRVKDAMNKINEAQRLQEAAKANGEAEKILIVKRAEAESESKRLQGEGIAKQRTAIINGLKDSVEAFKSATKADTSEVMNLVLVTQYFDTLNKIGADSKNTVIMIPHSPEGMMNVFDQMVKANVLSKASEVVAGSVE
jgi:regulator of protease activity HflC (stomatin/prohibitin superfamily)